MITAALFIASLAFALGFLAGYALHYHRGWQDGRSEALADAHLPDIRQIKFRRVS